MPGDAVEKAAPKREILFQISDFNELEEKIGNRNAFSRFTDKLGSWISMDKSKKSKFKAGSAGFLAGGLKGAAVGALSSLLGVTVPQ